MKKEERNVVIDEKIKNLSDRINKLKEKKEETKYLTNLKLELEKENLILRCITDEKKLISILGKLISMKESYNNGYRWVYKEEPTESITYCGYLIDDWIEDITNLINSVKTLNEIKRLEDVLSKLPKFYSDEKKDEIEFNNLLDSLDD